MEEIVGDGKYPDWLKETIKKANKIMREMFEMHETFET